ncbi:MAG: GH1, partial [uncultured Gemmatimonadaceae bacterium]
DVSLRDRDREQLPHDQHGDPHRSDGQVRPLRALGGGLRAGEGDGAERAALRARLLPHARRPRPVRLGGVRRADEPPAPARDRADRRPVPLRRPVVARRLPGPGLPGAVRRVRARLRAPLPVGALLHAGERDLRRRELLGAPRLVERVPGRPARLRARAAQHVHGARARRRGDPGRAPRRGVRAGRVDRALPRRHRWGARRGRPVERAQVPLARPHDGARAEPRHGGIPQPPRDHLERPELLPRAPRGGAALARGGLLPDLRAHRRRRRLAARRPAARGQGVPPARERVPRALQGAALPLRDEPRGRPRAGVAARAVERRDGAARRRGADDGLHLVLAHRPDRLAVRAARGEERAAPGGPLRPGPPHPPRGRGLPHDRGAVERRAQRPGHDRDRGASGDGV